MKEEPIKSLSPLMIQRLFRTKSRMFDGQVHIYTDGSKQLGEDAVVSAAYVVLQLGVSEGWKLPSHLSIMTAELFAIYMALEWFSGQDQPHGVIFTDSLSSVSMIMVTCSNRMSVYKYVERTRSKEFGGVRTCYRGSSRNNRRIL
jgi:ribonuclease HI